MAEPIEPEQLRFESGASDEYVASEKQYIVRQQEYALRKEKLKGKKQDRKERKVYANLAFTLVSIWLTLVLAIFVSAGLGNLSYSDSVLITLLTTTTIEVIGIFLIVARYLFPAK